MGYEYITKAAYDLQCKYGTSDPFKLAKRMGVHVMYRNNFSKLKGMYVVIKRSRFIFLNANLDEPLLRIVCAHELGHDTLHREMARGGEAFGEFTLYQTNVKTEYEANIFASELLIDTNELLENIRQGYSLCEIASMMEANANMVAIKANFLAEQNHHLLASDVKPNFLKG